MIWIFWNKSKRHQIMYYHRMPVMKCTKELVMPNSRIQHWWDIHKRPKCKNCLRINK